MITTNDFTMLLEDAARLQPEAAGSISSIFAMAMVLQDTAIMDHIALHYATPQHFTDDELAWIQGYLTDKAEIEMLSATLH